MSIITIVQSALEMAKNIVAAAGSPEGSAVLEQVKTFFSNFDVAGLVTGILKIFGKA